MSDIIRISTGASGFEGHEINRPVEKDGVIYYLYQRPTTRPVNSFNMLINSNVDVPAFTFMNEFGTQPQTYWVWYLHENISLWV